MVFKRYIKKKSGTFCGFYIYHSIRRNEEILTLYLGKETDSLGEIEITCNLIAQGLLQPWNSSEKDLNKYLGCYKK